MIYLLPSLLALAVLGYGLRSLHRKIIRPRRLTARYRRTIENVSSYRVGRCLGVGRVGIIYEVEVDGRSLALKVIYKPQADDDRFLKRLRDVHEAIAEAGLDCSGITFKVYEIGKLESAGRSIPYQLLEEIEGESLYRLIKAGRLKRIPLSDRVQLLDKLLACLQEVEKAGMHFIHVDPKT